MEMPSVSLAIMPFRNLSAEQETEFFSLGFVEDLITELTRFQSLGVLASQTSASLFAANTSAGDLAQVWGVDYVLEGSVRRDASSLRVNVQLVQTESREIVWSEKFDTALEQVFAIQDEITATVAGKLATRIDSFRLSQSRNRPVENLATYDYWLQGMECLKRGTLEGDEEARAIFDAALEINPRYARAFAGLSLSHFNEWTCQAWHLWEESGKNAFDYAARAAELNDSDAMVHAVLSRVHRFRYQHDQADQHAERALALNPNHAHVLIQVAISRLFGGDYEISCELARKAEHLNRVDWYRGIIGWSLFMMKRFGDASDCFQKAGRAIVNFSAYRAACAAMEGDIARAREVYGVFLSEYRDKIVFGSEPAHGEALRWAVQVEPFRCEGASRLMPDILREHGIDEIDVRKAIASRDTLTIRPATIIQSPGSAFLRDGDVWSVAYQGAGARLTEVKGFHDIARLLEQPGESIHCLELSGTPENRSARQDVIDPQARREYRQRIAELQQDLEQAEADNNPSHADTIRLELDAIIEELTRATGLDGKSRKISDAAERARTAVTWRIRSAIKKIRAAHPGLGQHLTNSIRTGTFCVYSPEIPTEWDL